MGIRVVSGSVVGLALAGAVLGVSVGSEPASAESGAGCSVTGLVADSSAETVQLRESVAGVPVQELAGVRLDRTDGWRVPGHGDLVLVVDEAAATPGEPVVTVAMFGLSRQVDLGFAPAADGRLVSSSGVPGLGGVVRTGLLHIGGEGCTVKVLMAADRSPFTTVAGLGGLGTAVVFGVLLVVVARRPAGGWGRRFAVAAPLGLLAGAGEAVLLHDAGTFDPDGRWSWWLPAVGVVLAAVMPLTRRSGWLAWLVQRKSRTSQVPAAVGRWQPETLFVRTEGFEVWRARPAGGPDGGPERVLVKVPAAGRAGEPGMRLSLAREAAVLSRMDHPHCVRLVEAFDGADDPVAVVLADVDGATLRAVLAERGRLSGPQSVTVMLGVLGGLGQVHELGLVHRGVRPESIWLDADGRVMLAGFELACPGVENAVAPEGAGLPYASPEQQRGEPLDARADLWSCGVVLAELLTAQVPEQHATVPSGVDVLPVPVAALLSELLAAELADRPGSAAVLADRLRQAAQAAYRPDWTARGALGAAVLAHGALGAATAGYAAGGAGAGAAGAAGPVASGFGAPSSAGFGSGVASASTASGLGGVTTATVSPATGAGAGAGAGGGTAGSNSGAVAGPAAAAAVAAAAGIAAVIAGSAPVAAATEVITPEAAQVIFVRTVDESREDDYRHLADEAVEEIDGLWAHDQAFRVADLVEIVVGVPPGQYNYPAWFVATAELHAGDTVAYLYSRFDRVSIAEPWLATILAWSANPVVAPPELDPAGWLAPPPDEEPGDPDLAADPPADLELVIDPAELPQRYADWYTRSLAAGEVLSDDLLALAPWLDADGASIQGTTFLANQVGNAVFFRERSSRWESVAAPDSAVPTVRLRDTRTAIVTFTVVAETTRWARQDNQFEPCRNSGTSDAIVDHRRHARIGIDHYITVEAEVPVRQPWRGDPAIEPVTVVINDDWGGVRQEYVPERSIPC